MAIVYYGNKLLFVYVALTILSSLNTDGLQF